mmetsp:Transcript_72320/g.172377  ORF Transcript_72320/g.172377 Transcript_72320/m.172377 type:complete len:133 (-) Transcript_72320:30-428(-)
MKCGCKAGMWAVVLLAALLPGANALILSADRHNRTQGPCTSSSHIRLPIGKRAGETVWGDPFDFTSGAAQPIGRTGVTQGKICGSGKFVFSPFSCERIWTDPEVFNKDDQSCEIVDLPLCEAAGLGCILVQC